MDYIGTDFNSTGSVIPKSELTAGRLKRGECPTCGRKCFKKKLFKMIPIDDEEGKILNGRCLHCNPLVSGTKNNKNPSSHSRSGTSRQPQMQRSKSYHPHSGSATTEVDESSSLPVRAMSSPPHVRGHAAKSSSHHARIDRSLNPSSSARMPLSEHSMSSKKSLHSQKARFRSNDLSSRSRSSQGSFHSVASSASVDSASCGSSIQSHPRYLSPPSQDSTSLSNATSPEELQRAALLLVAAAKEHGLPFGGALETSLHDIVKNVSKSNKTEAPHAATSTDFISDEDDETARKDLMEGDGRITGQRTGVLDRGGAFPMRCGRLIYTGSTRTVSSMSSIDEGERSHPTAHIQFQPPFRAIGKSCRTLGSLSTIDGTNEDEFYSQIGLDEKWAGASNKTQESTDQELDLKPAASLEPMSLSGESAPAKKSQGALQEETTVEDTEMESIGRKLQDSIDSSSPVQSMEALESLSQALISYLQDAEDPKDFCIDGGLAGGLVATMRHFPESPEIQIKVCEILAKIATDNGSPRSGFAKLARSQIMVENGAAEAILFSSMIVHQDNPKVQEAALSAILFLCQDWDENQISFWKLDVIHPILLAMEHHPNELRIQQVGATIISMLVNNPQNENARNAVGENGGIPHILRAISNHLEASQAVESCMNALDTLVSESPGNIRSLLVAPGATKTILDALRSHSENLVVQESGFEMLVKLTTLSEHTDLLLESRGSMGETETIKDDGIEEKPNELLEGLIETVLETIQTHSTVPVIQEFGFAILANLTDSNETKMFIVDLGALDAIVLAMVLHKDRAGVQKQSCCLLLLLAVQENHQHILAANPIELVKIAAQKYPEACLEPASQLLRQLGLEL